MNQQLEVEVSQISLEIRCKILTGKAVKHWNNLTNSCDAFANAGNTVIKIACLSERLTVG